MQSVGSGLADEVHCSTSIASRLRARMRLCREFFNRVNRQNDTGNARHSTLIYCRDVVPEIVIVDTINLPVHLIGPSPVQRTETANVVATKAGFDRDQLREVAPVQWSVLDNIGENRHGLGGGRGIDRKGSRRHFNDHFLLLEREFDGQSVNRSRGYLHLVDCNRRKATSRNCDLVRAQRKVLKRKLAVRGGYRRMCNTRVIVCRLDIGVRDDGPRWVSNRAVKRATESLRF